MEALKKRQTAVIIFVLVVVLFTLIGCHRSLTKACDEIEAAFFDKTQLAAEGYYTRPGDQLENCVKYANRLLSVINAADWSDQVYDALTQARQALADALDDGDISDIYDANQALVAAVEAVESLVNAGAALPESSDDYDTILADFYSAQSVAANSAYNDYVDEFTGPTLRAFPTNILRRLAFVSAPEKFE
ncbi:MAG: hypothetical protein LUG57_02865 [Oscillospiraceae bacterium]|nr:hypothetical protein [Oscillospiraceae bacterium]